MQLKSAFGSYKDLIMLKVSGIIIFYPEKGARFLEGRISRIKKIIAGICKPDGWFDIEYEHCANKSSGQSS